MKQASYDQVKGQPLILFDGVCNLCSGSVQFVIRHDRKERFHFAALQSPLGLRLTSESEAEGLESVLLYNNNTIYRKSSAALQILKLLGGVWRVVYLLIIIPAPVRDFVYDFIGQRRYQWFGKKKQCWIPDEALKKRFLKED